MSWKERLDNIKFSITTGDGEQFFPLWKTAEKSKDFNVTSYDFINVEGTFVDRKKAKGGKFSLIFYFQGDDNIEQCDRFELSANDNRIWTIEHPFYGTIKGQPTNLKRNDAYLNVTEVSVEFWESIDDDYPLSKNSIKDVVSLKVREMNENCIQQMAENAKPKTENISTTKEQIILSSAKQSPDPESFNDYKNKIKKAIQSADKLIVDTETSLRDAKSVIEAPANFKNSVKSKIEGYKDSYYVLKNLTFNLFEKYMFESQAASIIGGMCIAAINPIEGDYDVRDEVESANNAINEIYEDYVSFLDEGQVSIYNVENSWAPNLLIQSNLISLVKFTSNGLFLLSFDARQEREFELTEDTNLIILTHRFLGLDAEDKNIDVFRKINGIRNAEIYSVKKGRIIKYFI